MKSAVLAVICTTVLSVATLAADISGTWTGVFKTNEGGAFETTLIVKQDFKGNLSGTYASGPQDPKDIENGKVEGNQISFSLSYGNEGQKRIVNFTGTIEGNQIKLTSQGAGAARKSKEFTLTKQ
jgi:hypothetical protein